MTATHASAYPIEPIIARFRGLHDRIASESEISALNRAIVNLILTIINLLIHHIETTTGRKLASAPRLPGPIGSLRPQLLATTTLSSIAKARHPARRHLRTASTTRPQRPTAKIATPVRGPKRHPSSPPKPSQRRKIARPIASF